MSYGDAVGKFLLFPSHRTTSGARLSSVKAFVNLLLEAGHEPATARPRARFAPDLDWLGRRGEAADHRLVGLRPRSWTPRVVEPSSDVELKALLAAAGGELRERRDEATTWTEHRSCCCAALPRVWTGTTGSGSPQVVQCSTVGPQDSATLDVVTWASVTRLERLLFVIGAALVAAAVTHWIVVGSVQWYQVLAVAGGLANWAFVAYSARERRRLRDARALRPSK